MNELKYSKQIQTFDVLIVASEPSPIATLEKSSKRIQRCDVLIVTSETITYCNIGEVLQANT